MESLGIKIAMCILATVLSLIGYGLKCMFKKLGEIVPEEDIRNLISASTVPFAVKQDMMYEQVLHLRDQVDSVLAELARRKNGEDTKD